MKQSHYFIDIYSSSILQRKHFKASPEINKVWKVFLRVHLSTMTSEKQGWKCQTSQITPHLPFSLSVCKNTWNYSPPPCAIAYFWSNFFLPNIRFRFLLENKSLFLNEKKESDFSRPFVSWRKVTLFLEVEKSLGVGKKRVSSKE